MRSLLLPVMLTFALTARAQDASVVLGLLKDLRSATNDTLRADTLVRICFNLIRSDLDSARLVGEQALALAKRSTIHEPSVIPTTTSGGSQRSMANSPVRIRS